MSKKKCVSCGRDFNTKYSPYPDMGLRCGIKGGRMPSLPQEFSDFFKDRGYTHEELVKRDFKPATVTPEKRQELDSIFSKLKENPAFKDNVDINQVDKIFIDDSSEYELSVVTSTQAIGGTKKGLVISKAMLEDNSKDTLELMIAHEMVHLKNKDYRLGSFWKGQMSSGIMLFSTGVLVGTLLPFLAPPLQLGVWVASYIGFTRQKLRSTEYRADAEALELVGKNLDKEKVLADYKRMAEKNPDSMVNLVFPFLKSHPTNKERMEAIEKLKQS